MSEHTASWRVREHKDNKEQFGKAIAIICGMEEAIRKESGLTFSYDTDNTCSLAVDTLGVGYLNTQVKDDQFNFRLDAPGTDFYSTEEDDEYEAASLVIKILGLYIPGMSYSLDPFIKL